MHQIVQPVAVNLIFVMPSFEYFDNWPIEDKSSIIGMGLNALTVMAFLKLGFQIFVYSRLFVKESFLIIKHVVHVLHVLIEVVVTMDFMLAFHVKVSVTKNLRLKPFVIIRRGCLR